MTPNGFDAQAAYARLEHRMASWETILNRSVGELQGEFIRVTAALDRLTEEFKALRQDMVNHKRTP